MTDDALTGLTTAFFGPTTSTHGPRHSDEIDLERQQLEADLERLREIERVAREVVTEWDNINNPDELELGRVMARLRALVQP